MGAKREYTAIFAIGAKLLGSFRGAMAAAQSRLKGLEKTAASAGKSILKLGSAFTAMFGLAAFGAGAIFKKIFEGANEAAASAGQRTRALNAALMEQNYIRVRGRQYAAAQTEELSKHNEALAKQGVISKELLDTGAAQLAISRLGPREIAATIGPLSDALVAFKGINASQEDMQTLAKGFGTAVQKGMTKPLTAFGVVFTDAEQKAFKAMSRRERYDELTKRLRKLAGESERALKTPEGRIHALDNTIAAMQRHIGEATLQSRAEMADAWGGALEQLEPIFKKIGVAAANAATWAGKEFKDMTKALSTPEALKTWTDVEKSIKGLGAALTGLQDKKDETLGTMFGEFVHREMERFANDNTHIAIEITKLKQSAQHVWADFYGGLKLIQPYLDTAYTKTLEWIHLIDDDHIHAAFQKIGDDLKQFIHDPIGAIIDRWKEFKGLIGLGSKNAFQGGGGGFGGHGAGSSWGPAAAYTPPAGLPDTNLVSQRAAKIAELQDAATTARLYSLVHQEVGSQGPEAQQAFIESVVNRAASRHQSLAKTISDSAYFPGVSLQNVAVGAKEQGAYKSMLDSVAAGSNISNYATGNASGGVGFAGGPKTFSSRGENFGTEGPDRAWASAMKAAQPFARGGIVRRPTLAMLGERGAEAVTPLGRRGGGIGGTNVSFTPNITINGNATPEAQAAMTASLRDLARDFVDKFKRAQTHERRLSFEGGYG